MAHLKFVVLMITVVLFGSHVSASKRMYTTKLSYANELHQVVGSVARGSGAIATNINGDGYTFQLVVRGLSSAPTGVHLHAPATTTANAPVIITLCGNPAPSALGGACPALDSDGVFAIQGLMTSGLAAAWGLSGAQFQDWLENELVYINVHTALNPAGEVRGQLAPL